MRNIRSGEQMIFMAQDAFPFLDKKLGIFCVYRVHVEEKGVRNFFHQLKLEAGETRYLTGADLNQHCMLLENLKWLPTSKVLIHRHWCWQGPSLVVHLNVVTAFHLPDAVRNDWMYFTVRA